MKKIGFFFLFCFFSLFLAGCTAGVNSVVDTPAADGGVAGFWLVFGMA